MASCRETVLQVLEALEASFARGRASHARGLGAALEAGLAALELGQRGGQIVACLSGAADIGPASGEGVCYFCFVGSIFFSLSFFIITSLFLHGDLCFVLFFVVFPLTVQP